MKIAIVHDDLMRKGGGEQVTLALHKAFPEASIYTLCYQQNLTYPEFKHINIITSYYQNFVSSEEKMKRFFYPLGYWCMRTLKVKGYDLVILSSTYAAKYVDIVDGTKIIHYCHNPFRLAWYPESYSVYTAQRGIKKWFYDLVIKRLQYIDLRFSKRSDKTIVNSKVVKQRVNDIYGIRTATVINPPVNLSNFEPSDQVSDHYLVVCRLESYKKIDLVIDAFNESGRKLTIVGDGSQKKQLKRLAESNIKFKENLNIVALGKEYASAKALIFPQLEDFGITPLEANASGTPVIAYGQGGVLETIVPFPEKKATGLFFEEQSIKSLNDTINLFEKTHQSFSKDDMVKNAERFSIENFVKKIKKVVEEFI